MSVRARWIIAIVIAALLMSGVTSYVVMRYVHTRKLMAAYYDLKPGESKSLVVGKLGEPNRIETKYVSDVLFWDFENLGPANGRVKYQYHYFVKHSIIDHWVYVGFDEDDKVVTKHLLN